MADNKNKQDGRDDSRIDSSDPNELQYAAEQANVSADQVKRAIEQIGTNSRERVMEYIKRRSK